MNARVLCLDIGGSFIKSAIAETRALSAISASAPFPPALGDFSAAIGDIIAGYGDRLSAESPAGALLRRGGGMSLPIASSPATCRLFRASA
ncbi:Uncharacterised protein [Raoultella terrigena]|uniref:Uncharacterized protein n=1 Tax=Raoultella terrigena TaxID=577 RepID=A0A3P8KLV0_RAOTE|nr:Uncharacterised protein [Raoultella terrigena]